MPTIWSGIRVGRPSSKRPPLWPLGRFGSSVVRRGSTDMKVAVNLGPLEGRSG